MQVCNICQREVKDLDMGWEHCFDCVEAKSIIESGLDRLYLGPNGTRVPAKTAMEKLKFLVEKGWMKIEVEEDSENDI